MKSQKKIKVHHVLRSMLLDQDNMKMPLMRFRKSSSSDIQISIKKNKHDVFGKVMTPSYNVLCCFDYCNTLMFPSSVYNTIMCVMYKLIQPTISFKILVHNQDTFSILEILLKVSLKHHKPKPSQIHFSK
jgi:hypothetical protein